MRRCFKSFFTYYVMKLLSVNKYKQKKLCEVYKVHSNNNKNNNNDLYSANSIQCSNALYNKITVQNLDTIINTTIRIK